MQKIVATFLASLLMFPAGTLAQDSKINDGATVARAATPQGTLRESAIRQARLAAANDVTQAPQNPAPSRRPSLGSDVGKGALWGTAIGAGAGFALGLACPDASPDCYQVEGVYALTGAAVGAIYGTLAGF